MIAHRLGEPVQSLKAEWILGFLERAVPVKELALADMAVVERALWHVDLEDLLHGPAPQGLEPAGQVVRRRTEIGDQVVAVLEAEMTDRIAFGENAIADAGGAEGVNHGHALPRLGLTQAASGEGAERAAQAVAGDPQPASLTATRL